MQDEVLHSGWEERLRNDLCCVEWDVKPDLNQSINQWSFLHTLQHATFLWMV